MTTVMLMLTRPNWINFADQDRKTIRYVWDDMRAVKDLTEDAAPVLRASMQMSLQARMALCMGLCEWTVWRFEGLHRRTEPVQIAQVGWCAMVDPRYMKFFELTRTEWLGPVEGPLWCVATWLQPAMAQGYKFPRGLYDAISLLTRMALHVLPDTDKFQNWLTITLDRLVSIFPVQPEDPFSDLLDRDIAQRLGPPIGRNVLDPDGKYSPDSDGIFLSRNLRDAVAEKNPFLSSASDLKDTGFVGEPYVLPV